MVAAVDPAIAAAVRYDAVVVGAGTSGGTVARELSEGGMRVLVLEAGPHLGRDTYPRNELDSNSTLYWGGGVELTRDAAIGILRPRVVGGGGVVNQALMDRFDDIALDDFRAASGVEFFSTDAMDEYYTLAEQKMALEEVPEQYRNGNAAIFAGGFDKNGYRCAPLRRGQSDCHFEDGNCCVECLGGCRIDSKQSPNITSIPTALAAGATLIAEFEVSRVAERRDAVSVSGRGRDGVSRTFTGDRLVLASGAIGNSKLLLASGFADRLPRLGMNFFSHPQYMNLALFDEPVCAFAGPLQSYKSDDPSFRRGGFKLENVFAGPVAIAMLLPGLGAEHMDVMRQIDRIGCVEVCVRDQHPGRIRLGSSQAPIIDKTLDEEDRRRRRRGSDAIRNIFYSMGATRIIPGRVGIGLHLMGGLCMGQTAGDSVVGPDFRLHGSRRIFTADGSIFPNAPGINPSLTIQALSVRGAESILQEA